MPRGDKTKEPTFKMWVEGKSLAEIHAAIRKCSGTQAGSVAGWVKDWQRGRQGTWTPRTDGA